MRLWITLENQSGAAIQEIRFAECWHQAFVPVDDGCWRRGPACSPSGRRLAFPLEIGPGEATTVMGLLEASRWTAGSVNVVCVLQWRDAARRSHERAVAFPAVEGLSFWSSFDRGFLGLVKDLALPIVLLVLGVIFRSTEQRRAALQETWNRMLQKSHENAERHYMPVSAALLRLRVDFHALPEKPEGQDVQVLFEDFLVLQVRVRRLVQRIAGFYFKDRVGEELAADVWRAFRTIAEARIDRVGLETVVRGLGPRDEVASVRKRLEELMAKEGGKDARPAPKALVVRREFEIWVQKGDFDQCMILLSLLESLLDYEMNRPYEPWYGEPESFRTQYAPELSRVLESLRNWIASLASRPPKEGPATAQRKILKAVKEDLEVYLLRERAKGWARPKVRYRWARWRLRRKRARRQ